MLADLPHEIVHLILDKLSRLDPNAVWNVCLAGNHELYRMALPFTWRNVYFVTSPEHPPGEFSRLVDAFMASEERVLAARRVLFTFIGPHSHRGIYDALEPHLKSFINVTSAFIEFLDATRRTPIPWHGQSGGTPLYTVQLIAGSLPSLSSIRVEGCQDRYVEPWDDLPPSQALKRVVTRYCSDDLAELWAMTPGLQVVEVQGGIVGGVWGDAGNYTRTYGNFSYDPGVSVNGFLREDMLSKLTQLHLLHDMYAPKFHANNECEDVVSMLTDLNCSLPLLVELILDMEFEVEEFQVVWTILRTHAPNLKRLKLTIGADFSRYKPQDAKELLWSLDDGPGQFMALEELWLPVDGIQDQELVISTLEADTPNLKLLLLLPPQEREESLIRSATEMLAEALEDLEVVSWHNNCDVQISRGVDGGVVSSVKALSPMSWWAEGFRGVGEL
ncbi:hypothetical protein HGRIS_011617 [Hohenbuehelia grisea]|uniref:F-box domain-containing protein n=1 Tax=Hohenbuehelia grisea TaxID=104357 RepID=A0ABR3JXV4_9AGAR